MAAKFYASVDGATCTTDITNAGPDGFAHLSATESVVTGFLSALESLWQLSEQSPHEQAALYQRWLHQAHECMAKVQANAILWIQDKPVSGRNWRLPNLALGSDAELLPLPLTEQLSPVHYAQALELKRHVFCELARKRDVT